MHKIANLVDACLDEFANVKSRDQRKPSYRAVDV